MQSREFRWSKPKTKDTLFLVFNFDYETSEPVPIALLDWEHAKKFHKANPHFSIVPYTLNKIDEDTVRSYRFKIKKWEDEK